MDKQYCNAKQALTTKPLLTFALLCLVNVAVLTPAGTFSASGINDNPDDDSLPDAGVVNVSNILSAAADFEINAGHAGAWFNPETSGQGQFIDVEPEAQFMFISWFTYTDAASDNPNEQRWLTAQGNYSGDTAELALFETLGGRFDDPQGVSNTQIGEVSLSFSECGLGQMTYSLDEEGLQGAFPLLRVIPGSGNVCDESTQKSAISIETVDINAGMDGSWFNPATTGQGFFIDVHPDPEGGNFIFVSWFTFGEGTASGQRWLTAQGSFEGSIATIDVFETTGGSFDDPQATNTVKVGTMTIDFTDCSNAQLTYSLTDNGAEGEITITRVIPGGQILCQLLGPPDIIFFNGTVVTMENGEPPATALALTRDTIVAVGNQEVQDLAGPLTQLIDLGGRALLPGFVDPHTHSLGNFDPLEENQQYVLEGGVTSIGDPGTNPNKLEQILLATQTTDLRIRTSLYLTYNSKCDGVTQPEGWLKDFPPDRDPKQMLRVLGVKIFADPAKPGPNFCGWAAMSIALPPDTIDLTGAGPFGDLLLSAEEMAQVIVEYQTLGYQVTIHTRGDAVLDTVMDAIEMALDGQPNKFRHRIDHNDFIRPDQLARYGDLGALPLVRGRPAACGIENLSGVHPFGEVVHPWFRVARSLVEANPGLPVVWHSDTGTGGRRPIHDLYDLVTRKRISPVDGHVCVPPDWMTGEVVSVEEALRMMTINGAYALFMEDKIGSLIPGKFADLIVLSDNPLTVDPDALFEIDVLMTMVGGNVEHCLEDPEDPEWVCPSP